MAPPTLPTEKPPIWANFLNYTIGPDTGTPTKVDSASVAGNGHIGGKDFPTTGQEQNHWQNTSSIISAFVYDSIGLGGSPSGADDPRVVVTDNFGQADFARMRLWGSSSVVLPTLEAFDAGAGEPIIWAHIPNGTAPGIKLVPKSSAANGYGIHVDSISSAVHDAAGLLVQTNDTALAAILCQVTDSVSGGANVSIQGEGSAGVVGANGGDGVVGVAGDVGSGSLGGSGIVGLAAGTSEKAGEFLNLIPGTPELVKTLTSNSTGGTAVEGICTVGLGGRFGSTLTGAPIQLIPQSDDPNGTGGGSLEGAVWVKHDVVQDEFWILANLSDDDSRRRSVATFRDKYCRLVAGFGGSNANEAVPTIVADNLAFPEGMIPDSPIECLFEFTGWLSTFGGNLLTRNELVGQVEIFEGATPIQVITGQQINFRPVGGPGAGTGVTWGDRVQPGFVYIQERWVGTLSAAGANDFRVELSRLAADGGTVILSDGVLTVETLQ